MLNLPDSSSPRRPRSSNLRISIVQDSARRDTEVQADDVALQTAEGPVHRWCAQGGNGNVQQP